MAEGRTLGPLYREIREHFTQLTAVLGDALRLVHVTKAFGREQDQTERVSDVNRDLAKHRRRAGIVQGAYGAVMSALSATSLALVFWMGAQRVSAGETSVGNVVALLAFSMMLAMPLRGAFMHINDFFRAEVSAQRLQSLLAAPAPVREHRAARPAPKLTGRILIDHLSVSEGDRRVLDDITCAIEPGELAVLVGPIGAGKSTLLEVLARLRDPTEGTVHFDGLDARRLQLASLRSQIAYSPPEPWLFEGTIGENIAFAQPDVSAEHVERAAAQAGLAQVLDELPERLDTLIGVDGLTLSGGQRQRLMLARALLREPAILLLDNPTANLDAETAASLNDTISALRGSRTIVLAAGPGADLHADRVLSLSSGRVAEEGDVAIESRVPDTDTVLAMERPR
jgi:ATP-binding cassette subfamily B protein